VPRFRTVAVAGLAASALLLTSGAAYAGDEDFHRHTHFGSGSGSFGGRSHISSMTWAYSSDDLSDLSTATPDMFDGARATAFMMSVNGESTFRLHVRGIDERAVGKTYPAHLHEGPCVAGNGAAALGHYNTQKEEGLSAPYLVNGETEVHLDFTVSSQRSARVVAVVPFVPKSGDRSIVLHSNKPPVPPATAPARWACLPLHIQELTSAH
jgi:superoxide dismutase, Cu-Zn family